MLASNFVGNDGIALTCSKSLFDVLLWSKGLREAKPIIKIIVFVMLWFASFVICANNATVRRTDDGGDSGAIKPSIVTK